MKRKKRLLVVITILLTINILVRLSNCSVLLFGDYSNKNVYALDISSSVIWETMDGVEAGTTGFMQAGTISFEKGSRLDTRYDNYWGALGILGIHNLFDSVSVLTYKSDEYRVRILVDDKELTVETSDYCVFNIVEDKLVPKNEYEQVFAENEVIYESLNYEVINIYDDYVDTMKEFCLKALLFEATILLISVLLVIKLVKVLKKDNMDAIDNEDNDKIIKNMNLKYCILEGLVYTFLVVFMLGMICLGKDELMFSMFIYFLTAVYLVLSIVCTVVYFIKRKGGKKRTD